MDATSIKLVLIGNTGVGKTCIVKQATHHKFHDESQPTLGASYVSKCVTVGKTEVHVQIWDTAGQERYRGMMPMYFRGAQVALVVYSIDNEASFDAVDEWVIGVTDHAEPSCIIFLVGNKCDKADVRVVTTDAGEQKARDCADMFYEVSAKTGDRIDELFTDLCMKYLERNEPCTTTPRQAVTPIVRPKKGCCQ
jgi:small GTP-binding protein